MATDQEYKYEEISVQVESKGELFEAKGKKILQYGWKLYEECFKNDQGMAMEEFCASEKEFPEVIKETIFRCVPDGDTEDTLDHNIAADQNYILSFSFKNVKYFFVINNHNGEEGSTSTAR